MGLDGVKAGHRLLAFGKVTPGTCLNAVWRAFGSPKSDGRYPYSTATQALKRARELGAIKGYNINDAPEGSILFWSNVWGNWSAGWSDAGHIAIKGPGNTVTTIDLPTRGRVGRVAPSRIWSHIRFEGYAYGPGSFLGHDVTPANSFRPIPSPANNNSKPIKEFLMALSDEQQARLLALVEAAAHDAKGANTALRYRDDNNTAAGVNKSAGGVLKILEGLAHTSQANYDSIRFTAPITLADQSKSKAGGVVKSIDSVIDEQKRQAKLLDQIAKKLGVS